MLNADGAAADERRPTDDRDDLDKCLPARSVKALPHTDRPKRIQEDFGAKVTHIGQHNFAVIQRHVHGIVTVSDAQLIETMKFFAERMKIVVEPTGCLAAAAALHHAYPIAEKKVGVIISGGNVDLSSFAKFIS